MEIGRQFDVTLTAVMHLYISSHTTHYSPFLFSLFIHLLRLSNNSYQLFYFIFSLGIEVLARFPAVVPITAPSPCRNSTHCEI